MDGYVELPTMDARHWLANAAQECGYGADMAQALAYSAWWLENRQIRGVLRTCVYLLAIHGRSYEDLRARKVDDAIVCLNPVEFGLMVVSSKRNGSEAFEEWKSGLATADPVLAAPIIAQMLDYKYNVHIRYSDQHLVFASDGIARLTDYVVGFGITNNETGVEIAIRLVEAETEEISFTHRYDKRETLSVPEFRYVDGGRFRFG